MIVLFEIEYVCLIICLNYAFSPNTYSQHISCPHPINFTPPYSLAAPFQNIFYSKAHQPNQIQPSCLHPPKSHPQ